MSNPNQIKFAFVPTDGSGRPGAAERALVRSHCMRGRNQRKDSRRSVRQARRYAEIAQEDDEDADEDHSQGSDVTDQTSEAPMSAHPRSSDMRFLYGPTDADHGYRSFASNCINSAYMKKFIHPIDQCIQFQETDVVYRQWLHFDRAFLHSVLLTHSVITDLTLKRPFTDTSRFHLRCTLALLNANLSAVDAHLLDYNAYIILALSMMADIFGDYSAVHTHLAGLRQIIRLRGGLKKLRLKPKLHLKIDQLDLSWSLRTGTKPFFTTRPKSWNSVDTMPRSLDHSHARSAVSGLIDSFHNPKLSVVFRDLWHLAMAINQHSASNTSMSGFTFQHAFHSIQTRLLHLQENLENTLAESFRLGMLAFLSTTLHVPGQRVEYPHLAKRLSESCRALDPSNPELTDAVFWLLVMSSITVLDASEPWLQRKLLAAVHPKETWDDARQRLQGVVWINTIHDETGERLFTELSLQNMLSPSDEKGIREA